MPGETAHAVLCLDAGGAVLGANSAARQMLPALAGLAHGGVHAGDLFALPWQHLFDLAGRDAPSLVPLWSGLRIAVQAVRPGAPAASPAPATPRLPLKALEERLIQQAVRDASGNVAEAARAGPEPGHAVPAPGGHTRRLRRAPLRLQAFLASSARPASGVRYQ